ncbi:unnamed protein product, partial [Ectocarpus sp. 8 AP-2014]
MTGPPRQCLHQETDVTNGAKHPREDSNKLSLFTGTSCRCAASRYVHTPHAPSYNCCNISSSPSPIHPSPFFALEEIHILLLLELRKAPNALIVRGPPPQSTATARTTKTLLYYKAQQNNIYNLGRRPPRAPNMNRNNNNPYNANKVRLRLGRRRPPITKKKGKKLVVTPVCLPLSVQDARPVRLLEVRLSVDVDLGLQVASLLANHERLHARVLGLRAEDRAEQLAQ